jgi:RNA polymerase sigma factor (sigma-70 family)
MTVMPDIRGPTVQLAPQGLAFEDLFEAQYLRLARAMYLLSGDRSEGEDLAQEAFATVYERWAKVGVMESPTGYLYRTAVNLYRKRHRTRRRTSLSTSEQTSDPAEIAEHRAAIRSALAALSASQREALVLVEFLGLDSVEAASVLGISADSVRARIHRARDLLRRRFGGVDG